MRSSTGNAGLDNNCPAAWTWLPITAKDTGKIGVATLLPLGVYIRMVRRTAFGDTQSQHRD